MLIASASAVSLNSTAKPITDKSIIDATGPKPCAPALEVTDKNMNREMDLFSRTFDQKHYDAAMQIAKQLKVVAPAVSTWDLYDKAFAWERVRHYTIVEEQMHELEKWQGNLNENITNSHHLEEFIHHAKLAQKKLSQRYHDGEFLDPATVVPKSKESKSKA